MHLPMPVELRRGLLAVSVLRDLDIDPDELGVTLPGVPRLELSWAECRRALRGQDPESDVGRDLLGRWLLARRWAADLGRAALSPRLRAVGLPVDHLLHPGPDWVRAAVLGGALELGLGALGLDPARPDDVVLLPAPALDACGIDPDTAWLAASAHLEQMGRLAAARAAADPRGQLRPMGGCDAATLLGSRSLRGALAAGGAGLCAAVVPMRSRGWTRLGLVDPAFAPAAAQATAPAERAFARAVLVTADEVTVAAAGGAPHRVLAGLGSGPHR